MKLFVGIIMTGPVPFSKCWSSTVREKYGQLHVHICHCTFVSRPNGNENRTKMGGCTLM